MPISVKKQIIFATKWVIKLLKDKYRILNINIVISILINSLRNEGLSIEKKKKIHKEAIRNRYLIRFLK
jgi:ribosomal protein S7